MKEKHRDYTQKYINKKHIKPKTTKLKWRDAEICGRSLCKQS